MAFYLMDIECPPGVVAKINSKHGVTEQDVRDAVQWPARPVRAVWLPASVDPVRGPRLAVEGLDSSGRRIKVVLYPVDLDAGTWRLGTAVV